MSLDDYFVEGLSRQAITVITFLGHRGAFGTNLEEIQKALSWMPPNRAEDAVNECLKENLLVVSRSDEGTRFYSID